MSRTNILNLLLFVVVIGLAYIIYNSEQPDNRLERLTTIDANSIEKIHIRHNANSTTLSKQSQDQWSIVQPVSVEANNFRISSLLKLINAPIHSRYSTDEIDLSAVGLSTVGLSSVDKTRSSTSIRFDDIDILFGITNPATNLRYVMMGDSVFTIEDVFYPLLSSHFGTLVSFNLLPTNAVIEKIITPMLTIQKDKQGLWQTDTGVDADTMIATVEHWKNDQAFGVHEYLQRKDLGEVLIYLNQNAEPITFLITDKEPWLILARPELGIEYHLDIKSYGNLIDPGQNSDTSSTDKSSPVTAEE